MLCIDVVEKKKKGRNVDTDQRLNGRIKLFSGDHGRDVMKYISIITS